MSTSPSETAPREEQWDSSWSSLERHMVQLYTAGPLRTIHQFWQRCYFEDLWKAMGPSRGRRKLSGTGRGARHDIDVPGEPGLRRDHARSFGRRLPGGGGEFSA